MRQIRKLSTNPSLFRFFIPTLSQLDRKKYSYEKLAHLSLGAPENRRLHRSHLAHVKAYKTYLIYHFRCQILLFFWLLVLYHNAKRAVMIDTTELQFGKGSKKYREDAAHASILPSLRDYLPCKDSIYCEKSLLENAKAFYDDNNMTVHLPAIVNRKIDRRVEATMRKEAIALLNLVSLSKFSPCYAINCYINALDKATQSIRDHLNKQRKNDEIEALAEALKAKRSGKLHINRRFINLALNRQSGEPIKNALKRTQQELQETEHYRERIPKILKMPGSICRK